MKEGVKRVIKILLIAIAINVIVFAGLILAIIFLSEENKNSGDANISATPTITIEVSPTAELSPTAEPTPTAELTPTD